MESLRKLQELLRELFQLEFADLDFGLYRLLHLKRQEVEAFLTEQLPRRVGEAFRGMAGEERSALEKEVSELTERIRTHIASDAILESGEPNREHPGFKAKFGQDLLTAYETKRRQLVSIQVSEAQQAEVFNHLYAFFSRYYEAGDFIPRRRYGSREAYAVPYNGDETFFHWANKDQHYVKTTEAFRDYTFTVEALGGPYRVHFVLTDASVPPGNTKGDTRYFFPLPAEATWEKGSRTLRVPFHYRLPTEKEVERFGMNSRLQEALLQDALEKILKMVPDPTLQGALAAIVERKEEQEISPLLKRLRHFTRRNTTDYFIHKDLEGFLKRELEFYLKDQVLQLGDLEGDLESKRRTLRVIRQLAEEVIVFLAQIEEVEKRLFEKRKFVLRTDYLMPIKELPRKMWAEVLANKAQVEAWKSLFAIEPRKDLFNQKGKVNERFLEEHPTLVVDTSHFEQDFKDRLLAGFDDLDEATGGLLIHSENYQALRLLERMYASKVKCIYIDPPYNTGGDGFVYKDRYQHSSWLSMMQCRVETGRNMLSEDGVLFVSIDEHEVSNLADLLETIFGGENRLETIIWKKSYGGGAKEKYFIKVHEYILGFSKDLGALDQVSIAPDPGAVERYYKYKDEKFAERGPYRLKPLEATKSMEARPNLRYPIKSPSGGEIWPERQWWWGMERTEKALRNGELVFLKVGDRVTVSYKQYLQDERGNVRRAKPFSIIEGIYTQNATREIVELFSDGRVYLYPKPSELIRRIVEATSNEDSVADVVFDFTGGSGTTAHSVISLNRIDGGERKFILVEMADCFDSVLLPRVQKVMYASEWRDGKANRLLTKEEVERTPRLVKVLRLEGYEDALHNLTTEETAKREGPRAAAYKAKLGEDGYRLSYLARLPLQASASMLNLSALEHPFRYTIEVLTEDGPRAETVDLIETFNFLYGLHVERIETWHNDKDNRSYRAVKARNREGRRVLVLWRDMDGLNPAVERQFLEAKLKTEGSFDEMLINADSATPGFASLDGLFKRLMEEGES
jgi:adenine-specific DNA-methyltransferase